VKIFNAMFVALRVGGKLVTYSAKGDVRRAMLAAGFDVKKVEGPPGKREMLVAKKGYNEGIGTI
jgi:tRNA U34 5-methylaminomethyl-2-thiouridine-forming methyltransferase MnmC